MILHYTVYFSVLVFTVFAPMKNVHGTICFACSLFPRESLAQLVEAGKKVVDSPVHLADFGAALTSADSQQMQAVLECQEVWSNLLGCLNGHAPSFIS